MRVITGEARGRKLFAPEGLTTRPTSDMAKEAMFSIVQFEVNEANVLDLFAGSGQLGIEALSRGARRAIFIDESKAAIDSIVLNLKNTNMFSKSVVSQMNAKAYLSTCKETFDLAFLDPPYNRGMIEEVLELVSTKMRDSGTIIVEAEKFETLPDTAGRFNNKKEHNYGKAKVTVYRMTQE